MDQTMWKNAQDLVPGDRIITDRQGTVETVTERTEITMSGRTCQINTDQSEITTTLPCGVNLA